MDQAGRLDLQAAAVVFKTRGEARLAAPKVINP